MATTGCLGQRRARPALGSLRPRGRHPRHRRPPLQPAAALLPAATPATPLPDLQLDPLQAAAATPEQDTAATPPHRAAAQRSWATTTAQEPPLRWPWPAQRPAVEIPQHPDRVNDLRRSWRRAGRPDHWAQYVTDQGRRGVGLDPRRHEAAFLRSFLDTVAPAAQRVAPRRTWMGRTPQP